jgi:hypothetical protein
MVDEDGFGPTPLQVKMKKKNQAYQDRHLPPIGENSEVMRHIDAVRKTGKIFVYFKIYSLVGIRVDTLKQKPGFMSFLRDNNLFMNVHQYETYAISTVGHVFKRLPDATNCQDYKEMLEKKIRSAQEEKASQTSSTHTLPMIKIEVQTARVIHLLRDQNGQVMEKGDTYAIRIRCERDKVKEVSSLITSGICNDSFTGTFVPITAAIGSPDGYMKLVDENEDYRKNHSFIRISGLHPELVQAHIFDSSDNTTRTMKAGILGWKENGSNLVLYMEPSLNVIDNGEWRAVVKNTNIAIAMEKLGKIKQDAERHEKFRENVNENERYRNGICISSSTVVDTETMSYVDKLTGNIDAKTAENRRTQQISNTAPTASVYLFSDSMSGQGHSQASSVASRNAWATPLPAGNQKVTPIIRNIHQQRGGGLNTDNSGRSGGRGISRENSDMSLTLLSDTETIQSQLTRVEKNMANYERLIITQNAKLDKQTAELRSQKEEIAMMRQEQTDTNNNASTVSALLGRLMTRMVDIEQGRTPIGPRVASVDTAITVVPTNARKRIQLNTPDQSPAKPYVSRLGLETPESYHRKRREALEAAMEASVEAERLAFEAIHNGEDAVLPEDPDPHNELCLGIIGLDGIRTFGSENDDEDDDDDEEDSNDIAAQYNFNNNDDDEDDDDNNVSMMTANNGTNQQNSMIEDDPEDHGPSGKCG